jgi:hypothetical protein
MFSARACVASSRLVSSFVFLSMLLIVHVLAGDQRLASGYSASRIFFTPQNGMSSSSRCWESGVRVATPLGHSLQTIQRPQPLQGH